MPKQTPISSVAAEVGMSGEAPPSRTPQTKITSEGLAPPVDPNAAAKAKKTRIDVVSRAVGVVDTTPAEKSKE